MKMTGNMKFDLAALGMLYLLLRMGVFKNLSPMHNFLVKSEMNKRTTRLGL